MGFSSCACATRRSCTCCASAGWSSVITCSSGYAMRRSARCTPSPSCRRHRSSVVAAEPCGDRMMARRSIRPQRLSIHMISQAGVLGSSSPGWIGGTGTCFSKPESTPPFALRNTNSAMERHSGAGSHACFLC